MVKRKVPVTQDDEHFVCKSMLISTSTKKTLEVHDMLQLIKEAEENKKLIKGSPKFKLAGGVFSIEIVVSLVPGYICVSLANYGNEDQTTSMTLKRVSGGKEVSYEMIKLPAGKGFGCPQFLSHEKYQEWARDHEDALKLEVMVIVHTKAEGDDWTRTKILSMSESSSQETISTLGKTILEDDATTDFTIRCDTKNFRVHKAVLCARSEVLRASILTPMQEVLSGEIFVKDVGEKSLASVINYLYTGELELGEDPDIQDLTWAGTKYLLPGFLDLLALHLQTRKEELPGQMIADLLIAANRHGVGVLRKIAQDRIRGNREVFNDPGFRKEMESHASILMDVFKDL